MKEIYQPTWNSLRTHQIPKWFQDAKFGIYTHWGIYSVPGFGPDGSWYPHFMYHPGTKQYEYHVKTFGGAEKFGYKDFIPEFTGKKFDAYEWAEIFKGAGAQYAGPVGEHHDGFSMWDSEYNDWKATKMGPKRDVVGELENAIRKQDMRYMVALHHAENWWFYPHWKSEYDTADPKYAGLYGESHDRVGKLIEHADIEDTWPHDFFVQFAKSKPSKAFLDQWLNKTNEIVDKYRPDMLWFDFGLKGIQEHYKRHMLAHYYNQAEMWGKDVLVSYKLYDLVPGSGIHDMEQGAFSTLTHQMWLTDTTVDDGRGWGYLHDQKYKDVGTLVNFLVDNVSKNGYLLLNVGPKANGEIPQEAKSILAGMGKWLEINGDAIYGTTPWMTFGEGPSTETEEKLRQVHMVGTKLKHTSQDFRFTVKDENLYAICLGQPTNEVTIKSFNVLYPEEIKNVSMLGVGAPLKWALRDDGLKIIPPRNLPSQLAVTFKIERQHPYERK